MTLAVVLTLILCLALTPLAGALAWKCDAVSRPDGRRKLHCRPTPLWGGVSLYVAMVAGLAAGYALGVAPESSASLPIALALSAGILCLVGAYDDLHEISAGKKLAGQIVATLPVVLAGFYVERVVLFDCTIQLGWFGVVATMGWLLLGINALNLIDGMDGLASTVGMLTSVAVAVVAGIFGQPGVMLAALALAAGLAGFFVHNRPPARIYLGDAGSMVVGGVLAVLVLQVSTAGTPSANLTLAAALFFLPLLDTTLAIVRRSLNGQGLMQADRGHVHHRLLDRGMGVWQVLGVLGGACLISGVVATLVAATGQELLAWGLLPALTALAVQRKLLGHEEWTLATGRIAQLVGQAYRQPETLTRHGRLRVVNPPPVTPIRPRILRVPPVLAETVPLESSKSAAA
jgi:UDP-GlcNAc:undecaprenyl-phosphate GlcNAc-1-phosphate transferase